MPLEDGEDIAVEWLHKPCGSCWDEDDVYTGIAGCQEDFGTIVTVEAVEEQYHLVRAHEVAEAQIDKPENVAKNLL